MFSKQTFSFFLIAAYCTLVPLTVSAQYYSRNDRLEQRQPNHHTQDYRSDRDDRYRSRDRDRRDRDYGRYRSRYDRYDRDDCRRDHRYKRHRHRGLFDILIRI